MMIKPLLNSDIKNEGVEKYLKNEPIIKLPIFYMIFKIVKNIGIMLVGILFAILAFSIYWISSNSDVVSKAIMNPEEIRAMYAKCSVEKVYVRK